MANQIEPCSYLFRARTHARAHVVFVRLSFLFFVHARTHARTLGLDLGFTIRGSTPAAAGGAELLGGIGYMELIVICGDLAGPRSAWAAILRIAAQAALRVRLQPRLRRSAL